MEPFPVTSNAVVPVSNSIVEDFVRTSWNPRAQILIQNLSGFSFSYLPISTSSLLREEPIIPSTNLQIALNEKEKIPATSNDLQLSQIFSIQLHFVIQHFISMNLPNYNDKTSPLSRLANIGISKRNPQQMSWVHHLPHIHGGERSTSCSIRSSWNFGMVVGTNKNTNTNSSQEIHDDQQDSSTSSSIGVMLPMLVSSPLSPSVSPTTTRTTTTKKSTPDDNCQCCVPSSHPQTSVLVLLDVNPAILASPSPSLKEDAGGVIPPRRTSWNKKQDISFSCERSVHFSSSVQCRFIESRRRMIKKSKVTSESTSTRSISSYWYDEEEMEVIHNELLDSVKQMRARESHATDGGHKSPRLSSPDEESLDLCIRGLERFRRRDVMTDRSLQDRMDSIDAVLRVQAMMKRQNRPSVDHTTIAQTYCRFALRSQHLAIIRAKSDEAYVNQYVRQGSVAVE